MYKHMNLFLWPKESVEICVHVRNLIFGYGDSVRKGQYFKYLTSFCDYKALVGKIILE